MTPAKNGVDLIRISFGDTGTDCCREISSLDGGDKAVIAFSSRPPIESEP